MNVFSERKRLEEQYKQWIEENPIIKDCAFNCISFLEINDRLKYTSNTKPEIMNPIAINKEEVLILKTEMLLHPRDVEKVRNDVIRQIESGAVIIPNGFTYMICKRGELAQEGKQ